jgi:hypothetical protein
LNVHLFEKRMMPEAACQHARNHGVDALASSVHCVILPVLAKATPARWNSRRGQTHIEDSLYMFAHDGENSAPAR